MLVDASAWIHYLRSGQGALAERLDTLIEADQAALCGIALAEVRQGLRPHEARDVLDLFEILPFVETARDDYDRAGATLAELRRQGITVPVMDGVIAQVAIRHGLQLLEDDKHFKLFGGLERFPWRQPGDLA